MTQIDKTTSDFLQCKCGKTPSQYSIGYGRRPYYMQCACGKRMEDGMGGPASRFIECWNNRVRHFKSGTHETSLEMLTKPTCDNCRDKAATHFDKRTLTKHGEPVREVEFKYCDDCQPVDAAWSSFFDSALRELGKQKGVEVKIGKESA